MGFCEIVANFATPMDKFLRIFTIITLLAISSVVKASDTFTDAVASPKWEVRAVWLTTFRGLDWPKTKVKDDWSRELQKRELVRMLDGLQEANINTVIFQARTRGLTAYKSQYEPYDDVWTGTEGKDPGYDPLAFAIEECHKRNMECHAWVVSVCPAKGFRDPNLPSTAPYIAGICEEIARNYDVDGISLDYIRYRDNKPLGVSQWQACENITKIVRAIHDRVKAVKPWIKLSCSPIGKYKQNINLSSKYNAFDKGQDVERWTREGLMDIVFPMAYWDNSNFYPWMPQWKQIAHGKIMAPGLGTYFLDPREGNRTLYEQAKQHKFVRYDGGMGFALFRAEHLLKDFKGIYKFMKEFCPYPSLVPSIDSSKKPEKPQGVKIQYGKDATTLYWNPQPNTMVNVYASREWPVDITKAQNLIAARVRGSQITIPTQYKLYYAITTLDRYGNESDEISTAKEKFRSALSYRPDNSKSNR